MRTGQSRGPGDDEPVADRAPDDDDPDEYPEDERMPLGVWFSTGEATAAPPWEEQ